MNRGWMASPRAPPTPLRRVAALGVAAFLHLFDDLGAEGLEVTRIARGDDALVDDDLRILPLRAGIGDVGLDRFVGRHPAALRDAGLDQQPGRVADRGYDLLRVEDALDETQSLRLDTQQIRVDLAAGQHQRVIIPGGGLIEGL